MSFFSNFHPKHRLGVLVRTASTFPTEFSIFNAEKLLYTCILHGKVFVIIKKHQVLTRSHHQDYRLPKEDKHFYPKWQVIFIFPLRQIAYGCSS